MNKFGTGFIVGMLVMCMVVGLWFSFTQYQRVQEEKRVMEFLKF